MVKAGTSRAVVSARPGSLPALLPAGRGHCAEDGADRLGVREVVSNNF